MSFFYLVLAILTEVSGTTAMKLSHGFTKWLPSILMFAFYALSLTLLTLALKMIDVSIAYAIWSGVGTALIATIGIIWFKESFTLVKFFSILMIIAGVVGLNMDKGDKTKETNPPGEIIIDKVSQK